MLTIVPRDSPHVGVALLLLRLLLRLVFLLGLWLRLPRPVLRLELLWC